MAEGDLIQTGIAGLDVILQGGIPKGNVLLVEGAAGTGKTLLGMEFIYRGVTYYNEPGMIVSFEVAPQKLIRDRNAETLGIVPHADHRRPGYATAVRGHDDASYRELVASGFR